MQVKLEIQHKIQNLLHEIWSIFRQAGTTDQGEIITSLATFLTNGKAEAYPEDIRPHKPRNRYNIDDQLVPLLKDLHELVDVGTLFDRYMLFYSQLKSKNNMYPIPRHITDFMVKLLQVQEKDAFADFTCGTGGFLVNQYRRNNLQQGETIGIEISPDWIGLTVANAILHDIPAGHTHFYAGNALHLCNTDPWLRAHNFDCIAMAPPFGLTIDEDLAKTWTDDSDGRACEDIFTRLALRKLKSGGKAALIVPVGLTYKEPRGMPKLRKVLLQNYTIQAVISLPENVLTPFSPYPVCILFISNDRPTGEQQIWFFKVQRDGYTAGLNRDLLMEPKQTPGDNDLPLAEEVLLLDDSVMQPIASLNFAVDTGISVTSVVREADPAIHEQLFHGIVLKVGADARIHSIRLFSVAQAMAQQHYLLITASREERETTYTVLSLTLEPTIEIFAKQNEVRAYLQKVYGQEKTGDLPKGQHIYQDGLPQQRIAIAQDGRLLGVTLASSQIEAPSFWLQPERYIPLPEVAFSTDSPVKVLSKIQQDQQLIIHYVDHLLGQLEVRAVTDKVLPPQVRSVSESQIQSLGKEQQGIWELIKQKTVVERQKDEKKHYALYFTLDQLYKDERLSLQSKLHLQQTLDLFVRMGLLIPVLIKLPGQEKTYACYRQATALDIATFPERLDT